MNDQQPRYDCSKVCFYVEPTTAGPSQLSTGYHWHLCLNGPCRRDCAIYRDKPLPREALWRTAEQAPACLVIPAIHAIGEGLGFDDPSAVPPFPLPPKSAPSTWVLIAKVLALEALLLCFLPRKATEPPAPRAQLVELPPQLVMPDHSIVKVSYRGELANEMLLPKPVPPMAPNRPGDTFLVGQHLWVWTTANGVSIPTWIDP